MCFVYVVEHGTVLGITGGSMTVKHVDGHVDKIPKYTVEGISIFAKCILTSDCIAFCLQNGINVGYFSGGARYNGTLKSVAADNITRLRHQVALSDDNEFKLAFARKVITAKINNQIVVSSRYAKSRGIDDTSTRKMLKYMIKRINRANRVERAIGYEGIASRYYFDSLSRVVETPFGFGNRSKRPALDPFNCMLNLGYSILRKEIYGELENRNLNPYIGFIHKDKTGHPALVSDMIEEWRPVIVDSVVMSMIQGHEISFEEFETIGGDYRMSNTAIRKLIAKLEARMAVKISYHDYVGKPVSFREAIWHQADRLSRAIDTGDAEMYQPIRIR